MSPKRSMRIKQAWSKGENSKWQPHSPRTWQYHLGRIPLNRVPRVWPARSGQDYLRGVPYPLGGLWRDPRERSLPRSLPTEDQAALRAHAPQRSEGMLRRVV